MARQRMVQVSIEVRGVQILKSQFDYIGARGVRQAARTGILRSATPIAREVRRNAPKRGGSSRRRRKGARRNIQGGSLKKSIRSKVSTNTSTGEITAIVGPRRRFVGPNGARPSRYAHLVEGGTKPHGQHPGTSATRFMSRAQRSSAKKSEQTFRPAFTKALESAARRKAKR